MKKLVLMLILVSIGFVYAQEPDSYAVENDNHSSDSTVDAIVNTEPITVINFIETTDETTPDNTPEQDMTASVEASYSKYAKKLNIPLWYRFKNYNFNATIPYYFSKNIENGNDDLPSVSGLGDISIGASYGKYLEEWNVFYDVNFSIKLPTGDPEAEYEENGVTSTIALGSDTWDFVGGLSGYYFKDDFTYRAKLLYKYNGSFDNEGTIWDPILMQNVPITITTKRGDLFYAAIGADYRWQYRLTFGADITFGMNFQSMIEDVDQENSLTFMDIKPKVKYSISILEFVFGAKIPILTSAEAFDPDDAWSNQETRNVGFYFRTIYKLF